MASPGAFGSRINWEARPSDLEIDGVDLQAAGPFSSVLLDLREHSVFTLFSKVTNVAATAGDFSVICDLFAQDEITILDSVDLFTVQKSFPTNQVKLTFGDRFDPNLKGIASIGTEFSSLKLIFLVKLRVEITLQADGVSNLSITLQCAG